MTCANGKGELLTESIIRPEIADDSWVYPKQAKTNIRKTSKRKFFIIECCDLRDKPRTQVPLQMGDELTVRELNHAFSK